MGFHHYKTMTVLPTDPVSRAPVTLRTLRQPSQPSAQNEKLVLSVCNFLSKGWEVSILGLLAFIQQHYSLHLYMVGILSTVFIVCQIGISLFAGRLAHAIHSRNVVLLAIGASALAWLTLFLAPTAALLYVAYALGGFASGLFEPIGNSLVAKRSPVKNRGAAIGNYAAFGDMGRMAVLVAATALAKWFGVNNACAVLLSTNILALVTAQVFLARPVPSDDPAAHEAPVHTRELLKNTRFRYATAAGIADSFSSASLYIWIPFLLLPKGIDLDNTLYYTVIFFAGYMLGRLALGRLADKHGPAAVLIISEVIMAALILFLVLISGKIVVVCLLFVLGIFTRGTSPVIRAMVADSMDEKISFHDAFSAYSFASRSSTAICRPIYGYLASFTGIASVFYLASAVSLLTLYPASKFGQKGPEE